MSPPCHLTKATNHQITETKKKCMGFSIGKKKDQGEKKAKTRPQVDSNPRSTGPEASTLPADPFYFVVIICRLQETDFQNT